MNIPLLIIVVVVVVVVAIIGGFISNKINDKIDNASRKRNVEKYNAEHKNKTENLADRYK